MELREFLIDLTVCLGEGMGGGGHDARLWYKMIGTRDATGAHDQRPSTCQCCGEIGKQHHLILAMLGTLTNTSGR
jgi:hypothetical protein